MRKITLVSTATAFALALAACSPAAEEAPAEESTETEAADETAVAGVLDASTATAATLAAVEGVSEELAAAIVAGQPYASVADFNSVLTATLSEEEAAAVRANVFVPIDLNTATRDEINLVPGMTDRMAHEFEEYRPYAEMSDFDREIGKYVDEAEVARFRQYVTISDAAE